MEGDIALSRENILARCLGIAQSHYLNVPYKNASISDLFGVNGIENKAVEICHYCTTDTLYSILKKECLRFTDVRFLNDSTEFVEIIPLIKIVLNTGDYDQSFKNFILESNVLNELEDYKQPYIGISSKTHEYKKLSYRTYTCSFSTNSDSLNMWNYYATTSGINIVFDFAWNMIRGSEKTDTNTINKLNNDILLYRGVVLYDLEDKKKCILELLNQLSAVYMEAKTELDEYGNLILSTFKESINHMRCFFKNDFFSGEEEYRIVIKIPDVLLIEDNYKNCTNIKGKGFFRRGNVLIPYIDYELQKSSIKRITLNPYNGKNSMFELGIKELLWTYQLQDVEIAYSNIPIRKYD